MLKVNMIEDKSSNEIYASFFIRGKNLDPDEINHLIGVTPDRKFRRGDRYGKNNKNVRKMGFWCITSIEKVKSSDLQLHIEWLLTQLEPVKYQLRSIVSNPDLHAQISCVLNLFTIEWDDRLEPSILERIAALNIMFGISVYNLKELDSWLDNDT